MQQSESIATLAAALVKAQAAIQPAIKDKTNPAFRSRYADLGAVWEACRGPLTENGLSIVQMPVDNEPGRVALTTMLLHSSGEYISSTVSAPLMKNDPQGVGSALTYLRRYALSAFVGVIADEDDDANAASRAGGRAATYAPPNGETTPAAARVAFYERLGAVAGSHWSAVQGYLETDEPEPTTVAGWRAAYKRVVTEQSRRASVE